MHDIIDTVLTNSIAWFLITGTILLALNAVATQGKKGNVWQKVNGK